MGITVKCAGLMTITPKAPPAGQSGLGAKPLISDEEMQEQYRQVYKDVQKQRVVIEQHANEVSPRAGPGPGVGLQRGPRGGPR